MAHSLSQSLLWPFDPDSVATWCDFLTLIDACGHSPIE
jgi:hypothetical protein